MREYQTRFGALNDFEKGRVEIVDDDPKNYVFSNVFEVCSKAAPWERVAVATLAGPARLEVLAVE